jgi:hypothetical protein
MASWADTVGRPPLWRKAASEGRCDGPPRLSLVVAAIRDGTEGGVSRNARRRTHFPPSVVTFRSADTVRRGGCAEAINAFPETT